MIMGEQLWDANTFASAVPEMKLSMLFYQDIELRSRLGGIEGKVGKLEEQITKVGTDLSDKMDAGFKKQALLINPLLSDKEIEEGIISARNRAQRAWWGWIGAVSAAIGALAFLISGGVFLGGFILKTYIHVPVPTVEVAPPASMAPLHPLPQ